ncbi:MAG TPA: hypothetical protein VNC78_01990 [Actinomycetota bacterium]|nr:hypothetical protein [Actinomycetota bacterium]
MFHLLKPEQTARTERERGYPDNDALLIPSERHDVASGVRIETGESGGGLSSALWLQKVIEFFSRRLEGEHMTRRPADQLEGLGFDVVQRERLGRAGGVERVVAVKSE